MPIHVKVVSAQDYSAWVEDQKKKAAAKLDDPAKIWTIADMLKRGGKGLRSQLRRLPPSQWQGCWPDQASDGSAIVLDADHAKQIQILLNGAANGAMPAWKQLSDTDIAAVTTYTKNTWSNKTGQLVQPAEVVAQRSK